MSDHVRQVVPLSVEMTVPWWRSTSDENTLLRIGEQSFAHISDRECFIKRLVLESALEEVVEVKLRFSEVDKSDIIKLRVPNFFTGCDI